MNKNRYFRFFIYCFKYSILLILISSIFLYKPLYQYVKEQSQKVFLLFPKYKQPKHNTILQQKIESLQKYINHLKNFSNISPRRSSSFAKILFTQITPLKHHIIIQPTKYHPQIYQPVLYKGYLIGLIKHIYKDIWVIKRIDDTECHIPVYCTKCRQEAILIGSNSNQFHLFFKNPETKIQQGEIIQSSGKNSTIPQGYLIGTVKSVTGDYITLNNPFDHILNTSYLEIPHIPKVSK